VDVYNNEIICDNLDFMRATASIDQIKKLKLKKGYVIITKDSETADDIGVPAFVQECADNLVCGYHLYLIKNDAEIVGKFLFRLLQAKPYRSMFELKANGVTRFGLGSYGVKNIKIPIPPLDVQEKIIDTIDKKVDSIDKAILNIKKQIEKLKEYRASLIYNAVTGKIKI
jgi:type I restriction enzyme S subunit